MKELWHFHAPCTDVDDGFRTVLKCMLLAIHLLKEKVNVSHALQHDIVQAHTYRPMCDSWVFVPQNPYDLIN